MSVGAQRSAIATILAAVTPALGKISDHERTTLASLRYPGTAPSDPIKGIMFTNADTRGARVERRLRLDTGAVRVKRMWTMRYFWPIDDTNASEITFRDTYLDALMKAFTPKRSLNASAIVSSFPELVTFGAIELETNKLHIAEIEFEAEEVEQYQSWE
jgi:hypothetical protein